MNVRLYPEQVERLKASRASGAAVIKYAVKRWRRGDFGVVQVPERDKNARNVPRLESYPVRSRFGICDALLREILKRHWETPDMVLKKKLDRELKQVEAFITESFTEIGEFDYVEKGW